MWLWRVAARALLRLILILTMERTMLEVTVAVVMVTMAVVAIAAGSHATLTLGRQGGPQRKWRGCGVWLPARCCDWKWR